MRRSQILLGLILLLVSLSSPSFSALAQDTPKTYSDGTFSFHYPSGWVSREISPGVISVGNSVSALVDVSTGSLESGEAVMQIISPEVIDTVVVAKVGPLAQPEAVLAALIEVRGSRYGNPEPFTFNGAPAARAATSVSPMAIDSYVITLEGGYYAAFDLATYHGEYGQFKAVALAIAATMRYVQPLLYTLDEHMSSVDALAFTPDGTILASAGLDGVFLWDVATGVKQQAFVPPDEFGLVRDLDFAADGTLLVAGDDNERLRVWSAEADKILREFAYPPGSILTLGAVFSSDGTQLASVTATQPDTSSLTVWDITTGQQIYQIDVLNVIEEPLTYVSYNQAGTLIAASGRAYPIYLRDAATGDAVRELGHSLIDSGLRSMAFSPDGMLLAAGSLGPANAIYVWDTSTGELQEVLTGHSDSISAVTFSSDGRLIASGSDDQTVRVWDVVTGAELTPFTAHEASIRSLAFNPDGTILASGDENGVVNLWDLKTALPGSVFNQL